MSKFESELLRRLARGDDVEKTAMWFVECMIRSNLDWKDLTAFEVRFVKRIHEGYVQWMAGRKLN